MTLPPTIETTEFDFLGDFYQGKVRDSYQRGKTRYIVTTDRLSCFDRVVTTVPWKGQVLNQLAVDWFERTSEIVPNHLIESPDPNVMIVRECEILPIEVVVRGCLTGSAWRDYSSGRAVSGIKLPEGLSQYAELPEPIMTPSTKAAQGDHDTPISEDEIARSGKVHPSVWQKVREYAFELFEFGQKTAEERGLILVDTKYEFGLIGKEIVLADEIHTLDSSRYWERADYLERLEQGEAPRMLDKEPVRQWLLSQGFRGDGPVPEFHDDYRLELSRHYIDSYEKISGNTFQKGEGSPLTRIEAVLRERVARETS